MSRDRDDDYTEDLREERAWRARIKRAAWVYAGPGWIRTDDLEEEEEEQ